MRKIKATVTLSEGEQLVPPPQTQGVQDVARVQWYLTQRWREFYRQHQKLPQTIEVSAHVNACFAASLSVCQCFTTEDILYEDCKRLCLMFKSCKLYVNPNLKGFDLRIS